MIASKNSLVGIGLYSVQEASVLTRTPSASVRRWTLGYDHVVGETKRRARPIWKRQLLSYERDTILTFRDLMELRFVSTFRSYGVSLQALRLAAKRASEAFGTDHPFSLLKFRTDGKTIFVEIRDETKDVRLMELLDKQYTFRKVIDPYLYKGVEFDSEAEYPVRWWPLGEKSGVVLDPKRSFGRPIISKYGIPTDTLANAYKVEGSMETVCWAYEVPEVAVKRAVEYEASLSS